MRPEGLRILLVGAGRNWSEAVHAAAKAIGLDALDAVASGREAIGRIVTAEQPYSHVLVQASASDSLLDELHGLTSGEPGSNTALTLLGASQRILARTPRIARPDRRSVAAALRPRKTAAGQVPPEIHDLDFPDAFARSMIEVRFQPIVRVADGACVCLEALARLNHPAHGVLPPIRFVPQIEGAGLGGDLTRAMTSLVLAELTGTALRSRELTVALNVPLDVILDPSRMAGLDAMRATAGVPRERIVLELTESRPVSDLPGLSRAIERLRGAGYGVAIDDLSPCMPLPFALLDLPFSAVKLDIAVIRDMHRRDGAVFLVEAIRAAKAGGATVVAEGVEDEATWRGLAELGVDQVQGFMVSRPLPAAALPVWLQTWPERRPQLPGALRAGALRGTPDQTSR